MTLESEALTIIGSSGPSTVLAIFAYYALGELRQMRIEITALNSRMAQYISDTKAKQWQKTTTG